ncbi:MAG TPA: hypothetical protein VLT16_03410 [Candidatus Limnocylindrales bacterium]|nr:hypothetical protein [Candidatus Limnocylindrales bacterium]
MSPVSKRLCVFFPLAFLLSWYSWLLKAAHLQAASGGIMGHDGRDRSSLLKGHDDEAASA